MKVQANIEPGWLIAIPLSIIATLFGIIIALVL